MKSIEIISEIRKQAAVIKALVTYLDSMRTLKPDQKEVTEDVRICFNRIVVRHIWTLRKAYGDEDYREIQKIDRFYPEKSKYGYRAVDVINDIEQAVKALLTKILTMPGDDGANDEQSAAVSKLLEALGDWRGFEFGQLKNAFGMGTKSD